MKKLFSLLLCILLLAGCAETYDGPTASARVCSVREQIFYSPGGDASQHCRTEYVYDICGNPVRETEYNEDEPVLKTILRYDENGNVLRRTQYDVSGWLPERIADARYTYDDRGRITSTRRQAGALSWDNDTTVYDDEAMTRTYTGYNGTAVDYLNEQGWVLRTEQVFSDGQTVLTEFDRRPDGQTEAMRTYTDGVLTGETVMTYDDQGRILTQTDPAGAVLRWEYGADYQKCFHSDGSVTTTTYNPDGTVDHIQAVGADGLVTSLTLYRYTEIQIPLEEVSP